jgi:hypothetical protein
MNLGNQIRVVGMGRNQMLVTMITIPAIVKGEIGAEIKVL